jgi:hypothetical protein
MYTYRKESNGVLESNRVDWDGSKKRVSEREDR